MREDIEMYGGFLHPALEYRARRSIDWMGAELVATAVISGGKGELRMLWENQDTAATRLTIDEVFAIFPNLVKVYEEMETNADNKRHKLAEWSIVGWYVAHMRRHHRHHMAITCLPDRCMGSTNYDKDIATALDSLIGNNDLTVARLNAQLSYYSLKRAVALKAPSLQPIFMEISMDEFLWGVCIIRTRVIGLGETKGSFATFVLAGSPMHIMNHVSLVDIMPPGPNTKYQTNTIMSTNDRNETVVKKRSWEVVLMDRANGVTGIAKGEVLTDNYGDRSNENYVLSWGFMIPKNVLDCVGPPSFTSAWTTIISLNPPFKRLSTTLLTMIQQMLVKEEKLRLAAKHPRLSCVGWRDVAAAVPALLFAIRLAVVFTEIYNLNDECKTTHLPEACLTGNAGSVRMNRIHYHIQAVKNMSFNVCRNYDCLKNAVDRRAMEALDKASVHPIFCRYCHSFLPIVGDDDTADDVMIRYSNGILAGDQFLDDGMSANRSTARAAQSLLLAKYRKNHRAMLKYCGGTCQPQLVTLPSSNGR